MTKLTTIDFHGAKLVAIAGDRPETTLVAMKPIVEGMGLNWEGQRKKIMSHPLVSKGATVTVIPSEGGPQETTCLSLDLLNFWLATIHPDRIKDEAVRTRVIEYQTECARVLFNHFFGKAIASGDHLTAQQTGGIVKSVVTKMRADLLLEIRAEMQAEIAPLMASMQEAMRSFDPTGAFVHDYKPMLAILQDHKVPSKGRRALSAQCSTLCSRYLQSRGLGGMIRISRETGRRVFKHEGVKEWLAAGGSNIIIAARDAALGQNTLPFPKLIK